MSKTFTHRRKKFNGSMITGATKTVRIDEKTIIEVSISISDKEARKRFYEHHGSIRIPEDTGMDPIPSIIDDEMLPDLE